MSHPKPPAIPASTEALVAYALEATAAWHRAFGVPKAQASEQLMARRYELQVSEHAEAARALVAGNATELLDGWCDELFVAAGTMDALHPDFHEAMFHRLDCPVTLAERFVNANEIPAQLMMEAFEEVVRANFSKLWTTNEVAPVKWDGWYFNEAPGQPGFWVARDETGKIRKPPSFKGPDHSKWVQAFVEKFRWPETRDLLVVCEVAPGSAPGWKACEDPNCTCRAQ